MRMSKLQVAAALTASALASAAGLAGPFTAGNIAVVQMGDGAAALSSAAAAVFIVEINPTTGAIVQTISMPIATSGSNRALTVRGSSTSTGHMTRSMDTRYLTLGGYDTAPGTPAVNTTTAALVNRVIARVDANGVVDSSTALVDAYNQDDVRNVVSVDGSAYWISGPSGNPNTTGGVRYALYGAINSEQLSSTPTNTRVVNIFSDQLYVTSASGSFQGVASVGTGLPTTLGQITTLLPGFPTSTGPSSYDFYFADANTLYVADDRALPAGGVQKWTYDSVSATWTLAYTLNTGLTAGCRGLTGVTTRAGTTLYATSADTPSATAGNFLVVVNDTGAASSFTTIATAPGNTVYRGVDFVPVGGTAPTCYANCDNSTATPFLNVNDFICFQLNYAAGASYANCDNSTTAPVLNVNDFICFQAKFAAGCSAP